MPSSHLILSYPSPPAFNLSQHQGLFQGVSSLHHMAKILEFQLQHQSFQWIFSIDFLYDGLVGFPCSPRDSQESSPTPQFKSIKFFSAQFSLWSSSHSCTHTQYHSNWVVCETKPTFFLNQSHFFFLDTHIRRELKKPSQWKDSGIIALLARKPQSSVILPQVSQKVGHTAQQETLFLARGLLNASGFKGNLFQQRPTLVRGQPTLSLLEDLYL